MVQGTVLFLSVVFVVINLAVDLLYGYIDPRISPCPNPIFRTLRHNPIGLMGLIIVLAGADHRADRAIISLHAPTSSARPSAQLPGNQLSVWVPMSLARDILSRIIYGTRISLYVGAISVRMALLIGGLIGLVSGYFGGLLDNLLMRLIDIVFSIPSLILAIAIAGLLGRACAMPPVTIGIVYAPTYARLVRRTVLTVRNLPYIEAATVIGSTARAIIPSAAQYHAADDRQTSLLLSAHPVRRRAQRLAYERTAADPSWGTMLGSGRKFMELSPWVKIAPGIPS